MRISKKRRLEALEVVLDGLIELLNKKGVITRADLQQQILEDANNVYVEKGGIVYKVPLEEAEGD